MNDEVVKNALRRASDCPAPDELLRTMEMPAGSQQRRAAEAHVAACAHCRAELALAQQFESGMMRDDEREAVDWIAARLKSPAASLAGLAPRAAAQPGWWERLLSVKGLAAGLVLAAALIIAINVNWRRTIEGPRAGEDVYRSAPLRAIAPAGDLAANPQEFRWTAVGGASAYVLVVTEVDRTEVFRKKYTETSTPVPPEIRTLLEPGKTLQWTVTAEDSSGHPIATSAVQQFRTKFLQSN